VHTCIGQVALQCQKLGIREIKAVGVTNQRETTIVWDRRTGKPLYNAIVWLDTRTLGLVEEFEHRLGGRDVFRDRCGLPISTYFSALKLSWLIKNVPAVREAMEANNCCFGTVDSWLIWNLTGGPNGGRHWTDVTNASRTMLMNLTTLQWDPSLCQAFSVPPSVLPEIHSSSELYGNIRGGPWEGMPIAGCVGDQQAACIGQACLSPGDAKNTYGTGCFVMMNTGERAIQSSHGLLTTVMCKLGPQAPVVYALEGSVAIAGAAVQWLRDNLKIIDNASEIESLAASVKDSGGLVFVPAFSGLFAPHWRYDARGLVIGITLSTTRAHVARAVLDAVCFQTREVLESMAQDAGHGLNLLKADGGMAVNKLLMQLQTDIMGVTVERPNMIETTALGAAVAAGLCVGVWTTSDVDKWNHSGFTQFKPEITQQERDVRFTQWNKAVKRSFDWV